ncbi:MAG: hypothetical protein CH6_4543 [Candidatus Kapaibacterium sp.]|nr:MAG: hypothetical protein CH6_4543 [Candidatus Kapabacteria bacterium]
MPTKELIAGSKITERMLVPHLRKRTGGKSIYQILEQSTQELWGICGEDIDQYDVVYLSNDGKVYKADALNNKPGFAIAKESGSIDQQINLTTSGIMNIPINGSIPIGSITFLRSSGKIGIIERSDPGDIIQPIGIKVEDEKILISIFEFYIIE